MSVSALVQQFLVTTIEAVSSFGLIACVMNVLLINLFETLNSPLLSCRKLLTFFKSGPKMAQSVFVAMDQKHKDCGFLLKLVDLSSTTFSSKSPFFLWRLDGWKTVG